MGRAPCCDKANVKRGPWSPEEDATLKNYVQQHGTGGNWIALPQKAGLRRCGKSCRLRWLNYLRPDIKHGGFTEEEDNVICSLFSSIGSRWSIIAAQLPGRTDNDIKNYWNTRLKKKLLGKCKDQRTTRRLNSTAPKQLESVLSASPSSTSSVSLPAHDDHMSSSAAAALPYSNLDPAGIAPLVNMEQSSSPLSKMSSDTFANTQEKYSLDYSTLANMLLRPEFSTNVGDDYSSTNGINYIIPAATFTSKNASIGQISPSAWDIPAGQPHQDAQNMYGVVKIEPSHPVLDQNGWSAASMALWENCCRSSRGNSYTESSWLNVLTALDDHHAAHTGSLTCGSLTPAELNEILYCDNSLLQPKEEPTNYYALQNGVITSADTPCCNISSPKSSVTWCPNYSDNYILLGSSDEGISSQGVFHEDGINC